MFLVLYVNLNRTQHARRQQLVKLVSKRAISKIQEWSGGTIGQEFHAFATFGYTTIGE